MGETGIRLLARGGRIAMLRLAVDQLSSAESGAHSPTCPGSPVEASRVETQVMGLLRLTC